MARHASCAYGVHCGSVPNADGAEEVADALERSHRGSAVILCPYDGLWRFGIDFSVLRDVVDGVCSCFDRVISHVVAGISVNWQRMVSSGLLGVQQGRAIDGPDRKSYTSCRKRPFEEVAPHRVVLLAAIDIVTVGRALV